VKWRARAATGPSRLSTVRSSFPISPARALLYRARKQDDTRGGHTMTRLVTHRRAIRCCVSLAAALLTTSCASDFEPRQEPGSQQEPGPRQEPGPQKEPEPPKEPFRCDDSLKTAFKPDADTTVTLVRAFSMGESLALADTPEMPAPPVAENDLCLVKVNVGPGNPGPDGAPSSSAGIGIESGCPPPPAGTPGFTCWAAAAGPAARR